MTPAAGAVPPGPDHGPVPDTGGSPPPFAPGSISIRLYPHDGLDAGATISELCTQAGLALEVGFDGVMTSEHHGGFAGYLPNPLQMATFVLEEHAYGWVAACPLLLPLRPTALVAEEVAWLSARHPGRVGLGVAAGALPLDFEVMGLSLSDSAGVFASELPRLVDMLRGLDLGQLGGDQALRACSVRPVPVLSAAVSTAAARRAARCGAGILMEGMSPVERLARLTAEFDAGGGTGSKVLIRRVWLGALPSELVGAQRRRYDSYAGDGPGFRDDQTVCTEGPADMVDRLFDQAARAGADALNLRVHLPGMSADSVRGQIARIGTEVVEPLKARWEQGLGSARAR
jgi:alkanesulfonate monooxygenase SsuD/methylene tetrahydromethanopterin reductase-like flavin-dependent oxidoreductase (luciferase family)